MIHHLVEIYLGNILIVTAGGNSQLGDPKSLEAITQAKRCLFSTLYKMFQLCLQSGFLIFLNVS